MLEVLLACLLLEFWAKLLAFFQMNLSVFLFFLSQMQQISKRLLWTYKLLSYIKP